MRLRARSEEGVTIVVAIMLMTLMLMIGLASYAYVDVQQRQSSVERLGESAFNLTEGALNTQAFILSRSWPGLTPQPQCTNAGGGAGCPDNARLMASFTGPDYASGSSWSTTVRDDGTTPQEFYDATAVNLQPNYDANANKRLWVRSEGIVAGRRRTLAALVQIETRSEELPRKTIIAGRFSTSNSGNKIIVETNSTATSPHEVLLRCDLTVTPCDEYSSNGTRPQVNGTVLGGQFVGKTALDPATVERLKARAEADGTYFPAGQCPTGLAGAVVFVENANCTYTGNANINSAAAPGVVIFRNGTLNIGGTANFYGVIYMLNEANSSDDLVTLNGTGGVYGGIFVDGPAGGIKVGSSKLNLVYTDSAFSSVTSYGTASVVQNSFREIASP